MAQPGRNDRCPCGSGRKFKHCCQSKKTDSFQSRLILMLIAGAILAAVFAAIFSSGDDSASGRVWSAEHGHYHDTSGREIPR